ncbi:MAG: zinc-ribbon domain-containing protein [Euryarchaeota archaeon]|nr:zinc-ribbon domain-containing protein [Euryarchaeota archaeon]
MGSDRIFCDKCGAENEKSSKFCKKCGANLHAASAEKPSNWWYLLPILFGILGGIIGYIVIRVKDEKMAKNILYVGLGTFVLGVIFIAAVPSPPPVDTEVPISTPTPVAVMPTVTQIPSPTPSEPLITKTPSEIVLTIDDLPGTGWAVSSERGNETQYESSFDKKGYGGWMFIDCYVRKYPTIEAAKQAYSESKEEHSDYKLDSMHLGDESFGYQYAEESEVVFREKNIVVTIEYFREYGSPLLSNTKNFAEIVEKKIV